MLWGWAPLMAQEQLEALEHFMRYRRVPHRLQRRVRAFYKHMQESMHGIASIDLVRFLPGTLRRQLVVALNQKLFLNVRIFHKCDSEVLLAFAERLRAQIAMPGEYILRQGLKVHSLYLLSRGRALVLQDAESKASDTPREMKPAATEEENQARSTALGSPPLFRASLSVPKLRSLTVPNPLAKAGSWSPGRRPSFQSPSQVLPGGLEVRGLSPERPPNTATKSPENTVDVLAVWLYAGDDSCVAPLRPPRGRLRGGGYSQGLDAADEASLGAHRL